MVKDDSWATALKPGSKDIAEPTFRIIGIDVGTQFEQVAAKLGKVTIAQRGDAATGREQACSVSARAQNNVHLIFEFGEVESVFYLFEGRND